MFWPYAIERLIFVYDTEDASEEMLLSALTKLMTEMVRRGYTVEEIEYLICLNKLDGE
ncbi:hypothetical protein N9N32_00140 [Alphaproteobacteria bacterium]|jgi:hypothetical protein|nr:hypothetical protein [Alphaproteobacteria bacterium]